MSSASKGSRSAAAGAYTPGVQFATCTTQLLISLLLDWSGRLGQESTAVAELLLCDIAAKVLADKVVGDKVPVFQLRPLGRRTCRGPFVQVGSFILCDRVCCIFWSIKGSEQNFRWREVPVSLLVMSRHAEVCPHTLLWRKHIVSVLAEESDITVRKGDGFSDTPTEALLPSHSLRGVSGRRVIDYDA